MGRYAPMFLTFARLASPLAIVPLILNGGGLSNLCAVLIFSVAALSDWADGFIARKMHLESKWGKILDPIADKLLCLLSLLALTVNRDVSAFFIIFLFLTFARELLMSALREGLAGKEIPVSLMSRAKTFATYISIGFLIIGHQLTLPGMVSWGLSLVLGYIAIAKRLVEISRA